MELSAQEDGTVALAVMLTEAPGHVTLSPLAALTTDDREAVPAKLFTLTRETEIEVPLAPRLKLTGVLRLIEKSPT